MECLAGSQLAELLSGAASPDLVVHVDDHIDSCADCRQLLLNLARAITSSMPHMTQADAAVQPAQRPAGHAMSVGRRYRILDLLGEGGMGRVYRAYDRLLGTEVALKQVLLSRANTDLPRSVDPSADAFTAEPDGGRARAIANGLPARTRGRDEHVTLARLKMLADEFRALATLRHPNIVNVLDYGSDGEGRPFYTMELLPGAQPLLLFAHGRPVAEQVGLLIQVLYALAYLHRRGILHRDLTPSNVLVVQGAEGAVVKIVDFGLALDAAHPHEGSLAGTILYMAPELFQGQSASESSDLYAVGVMAHQMLTGTYPFRFEDGAGGLLREVLAGAPDLSLLPAAMRPVIGQALSKAPRDRQANAATLLRELALAAGLPMLSEPVATRDSYLVAARFVGRQTELLQLQSALYAAQQGSGAAWLVSGESGVGKSRLLEELRSQALRAGVMTVRGQAMFGGPAFHLWSDVLRLLALQVPPDELEAGILGTLLPDLPLLIESVVIAPPQVDSPSARLRLFHVVDALLQRLPETMLVLLEDLQFADAESMALLAHLASAASRRGLLLVATYRTDDGARTADALPQLCRLRLPRLTRMEMAELCESMLGRDAHNQGLLDLVATETEGNAYFIVEVMRALAASSGSLADIGLGGLPQRFFAGGIEQVLEHRLSRAPAAARPLLNLAAVAGREIELPLMSHQLPDVEAQILNLADVGLLEFNQQRYRFSHDKLRERVLVSLPVDERKQLHRSIATSLEQLWPGDEGRAAQVAFHYGEAHMPEKAAQFYVQAGDTALRRGAPGEAAMLLDKARLLHAQVQMPRLAEVRLWRGITEARFGLGRLRESEDALRQLCAVAGTPLPTEPLRLWSRVGRLAAGLLGSRLGWSDPATSSNDPEQRAIWAELLAGLGVEEVFVWTDQPELGLLCTLFGMSLENRLGMAPRRNYHRSALFFILSHTPLRGPCLRHMEYVARHDADVLAGTHAEIDFLRVRALVEINDGQLHRAAQHAAQAVALARAYKDDLALLHSLLQLQLTAAGLDDFPRMLAISREMEPLAQRAENARYLALAYIGQGAAQLNMGDYPDAVAQLEKAHAYLPQELGPIPESITLGLMASGARHLGAYDRAGELSDQALTALQRTRWNLVQLRHPLVCILDAYLAAPRPERYETQIKAALARLKTLARRFPQAVSDAALFHGRYFWRFGMPQRALHSFRKSIETASKFGTKTEAAIAHYWFGCFAQSEAGRGLVREGAEPHLRAALATFQRTGARGMMRLTEEALQEPAVGASGWSASGRMR